LDFYILRKDFHESRDERGHKDKKELMNETQNKKRGNEFKNKERI
jgi:hypothetical protein